MLTSQCDIRQNIIIILHTILVSVRNLVTNRPRNNIFARLPCRQKKKRKRWNCLFCKRCIILLRPTFANNFNISSDYSSRRPSSIDVYKTDLNAAPPHIDSFSGYIICLGRCLAFLTLFGLFIKQVTSQRDENSWNWDETPPIACVASVSVQLGSKELQGSGLCSTKPLAMQATLPILQKQLTFRSSDQQRCLVKLKCNVKFPRRRVFDILSRQHLSAIVMK